MIIMPPQFFFVPGNAILRRPANSLTESLPGSFRPMGNILCRCRVIGNDFQQRAGVKAVNFFFGPHDRHGAIQTHTVQQVNLYFMTRAAAPAAFRRVRAFGTSQNGHPQAFSFSL
jgi:hypothetical protein